MKDMCIIQATKAVLDTMDHRQYHEWEIQLELFSVHLQYIRTPSWPAKKITILFTEVRSRYPGYKNKVTEVLLANLSFNIIRQNR